MNIIVLIIGILVLAISIVSIILFYTLDRVTVLLSIFSMFFGLFLIFISFIDNKPSAIDVYRNKTTLEITYKDGIAIDSTVVFKDKEK